MADGIRWLGTREKGGLVLKSNLGKARMGGHRGELKHSFLATPCKSKVDDTILPYSLSPL